MKVIGMVSSDTRGCNPPLHEGIETGSILDIKLDAIRTFRTILGDTCIETVLAAPNGNDLGALLDELVSQACTNAEVAPTSRMRLY